MNTLFDLVWIELRKAHRSRMPLYTLLASFLIPLGMGFLMFIYKNPEFSRKLGLVSAKANLLGKTADWPSYLGLFSQASAAIGLIFFSLIIGWIFGREFVDKTVKDLLAVPVSRGLILAAKFIVFTLWALSLIVAMFAAGLALGALIGLPGGTTEVIQSGVATLVVTALLTVVAILPFAFFASVGRGYLLPIGMAVVALILANILGVAGWANYFPWAIAGLYTQGAGAALEPVSYWIVVLTGLVGVLLTYLWWKYADQSR
jgi:ABC-2 type transport system permease protein